MTYVAIVVLFLYNLYTYNTVRWKMSRLCPAKKMSLIGKYRRNVIEWKETINLIVYFCLGALANVFCVRMFTKFETMLNPQMIFLMSSLFWKPGKLHCKLFCASCKEQAEGMNISVNSRSSRV